jgi:hypothetical protein
MIRLIALAASCFAVLPALPGADPLYESARRKLELIENRKVVAGAIVSFTPGEINAWARVRVPEIVPQGIRGQHVDLSADAATGYAKIDFLKLRHAQGQSTNWLITKLIEGERDVKVSVRLQSGGGKLTVFLTRVQIGMAVASGPVLDVLLKTFFLPLYPEAHIDQAFDLDYNIDRIEVRPAGVRVTIKK